MGRIAGRVARSIGWTRRLIAVAAGAVGALALAPLNVEPAMVVPMVAAVWLLDGRSAGPVRWLGVFGDGWWLGFGYHVAGFWWLGAAFLIDPDFTWALPFGVLGVPALLSLFSGVGFLVARLVWRRGAGRIAALAVGLTIGEWLRGRYLFTGFPWNSFGMALGDNLVTAQTAALVGLDGLTFLAVLILAAPATLADGGPLNRRLAPTLCAVAATLAMVGYGSARLARPAPQPVAGVVVRIMQPGLRPDLNFSYENRHEIVSHYLALSQEDDEAKRIRLADVSLLVWPESAFPFILTRDPQELARIGDILPAGTTLVTGAAREVDLPAGDGRPAHSEYFNAVEMIAAGGRLIGSYDKVHLVPFGEYLPLDGLLRRLGLRNFVSVPGGFDRGGARLPFAVPGLPAAAPLICYEAIFPGEVGVEGDGGPAKRPGYLLNVTNDGWFGVTSGPSQHFAQARLRTIEEGLPMVRGAATGISAVLDAYGRTLASLPLGAEGILDAGLPGSIDAPPFTRLGNWPLLAAGAAILLALALLRSREH